MAYLWNENLKTWEPEKGMIAREIARETQSSMGHKRWDRTTKKWIDCDDNTKMKLDCITEELIDTRVVRNEHRCDLIEQDYEKLKSENARLSMRLRKIEIRSKVSKVDNKTNMLLFALVSILGIAVIYSHSVLGIFPSLF